MQAYSNPKREEDPYALPDVEVFYWKGDEEQDRGAGEEGPREPGYYWWSCMPGCLPDGDPYGPFDTQAEALADAQSCAFDDEEEGDLSEREQAAADVMWRECMSTAERVRYILVHRSQFDFTSFADMLGCARGHYFGGYASELLSP